VRQLARNPGGTRQDQRLLRAGDRHIEQAALLFKRTASLAWGEVIVN
jgi:hypothetical protein